MKKTELQQHLLTAHQLVLSKHHPDSLSAPCTHYRSVYTVEMTHALRPMILSGQFDGGVLFSQKYPHSPYIILKPYSKDLNVPGSGVNPGSLIAHQSLDVLAFYSGKFLGWHGCTESYAELERRINNGELLLSGKLS
ncbi:hypothetical protein [Prosthecobacter sp.]|jgi:hypothetical protein|uniref:hypothetical protein n=1 Tax=Prosthecobacter sp. TaxID=1965333 RepID=UPI0037C4F366